jgi:hypothetical protein
VGVGSQPEPTRDLLPSLVVQQELANFEGQLIDLIEAAEEFQAQAGPRDEPTLLLASLPYGRLALVRSGTRRIGSRKQRGQSSGLDGRATDRRV